jgi:hypothetical protein
MSSTPLPKTSAPAQRALDSIEIKYLEDLTKFTEKEIADLHGMGPKAINILKTALKDLNLSFKS